MMKTNVTIKLDKQLVQEASVYAARQGISLSRLIAEELERLIKHNQFYDKAMQRALSDMNKAPSLGYHKLADRSGLHER